MIEDKAPQLTPISQLGEFGLIKHLTEKFVLQNPSSHLGVGDDAAVVEYEVGQQTVVSTDLLIEGVHFNLNYAPLKHVGYKAVVVNLSDIAAMNAVPQQILVSVAVSNRFPVEAMEELYVGIGLACTRYGVDLIGGDTTSSTSGLMISVTAIGKARKDNIVTRQGAKEHNLLVVTGDLGAAYMGLQVLERENAVFLANPDMQPEMEGYEYILERQLKPEARTDVNQILQELDVKPTAMIDISDGLASEVLHLAEKSGVGFQVYEEKIPLDALTMTTAEEFHLNPVMAALNGGEDYELLFTIAAADFDKIKNHPDFTVIGHAVSANQGNHLVLSGSHELAELKAQGWENFKNQKKNSA